MKQIKLTKLRESPDPTHPNNIPEGDWRIGTADYMPKVGTGFLLNFVTIKNGMKVQTGSFFYTSNVVEIIDDTTFRTLNSIYKIEILKDNVELQDIL